MNFLKKLFGSGGSQPMPQPKPASTFAAPPSEPAKRAEPEKREPVIQNRLAALLAAEKAKAVLYPNKRDDEGFTPLFNAVNHHDVALAKQLLEAGARVNDTCAHNKTPLYEAASHNQLELVRLLLEYGADPNTSDNRGWTPLDSASKVRDGRANSEMVTLLLARGAKPELMRSNGTTLPVSVGSPEPEKREPASTPVAPQTERAKQADPSSRSTKTMKKLREVVCVSGPHMSKIILLFDDGTSQTAGPHTRMTFGYLGEGTRNFSAFLSSAGFAFTDATKFEAPCVYRNDGTTMKGTVSGNEICWSDGTKTPIPAYPY
jgi:hypothetical protein